MDEFLEALREEGEGYNVGIDFEVYPVDGGWLIFKVEVVVALVTTLQAALDYVTLGYGVGVREVSAA